MRRPSVDNRYKATLLGLLLLVAALAYLDRVLIQTLAQPIKQELRITDLQLGILSGLGFALLYSTLALPIARLAERYDRITIISISVAIFSLMALLTGLATDFRQTLFCRIGIGIGEAGVQAPSTSLISDHFPPHRRGFALTVVRLGAPVGSVTGSLLGAWVGQHYGWRVAMMAFAAPGLLVAVLFRAFLREPRCAVADFGEPRGYPSRKPLIEVVKIFLLRRAFIHMLMGLALTTMGLFAGGAFTSLFFMRVHGLSLTQAGIYTAILTGIASTVGMSTGGLGIDFISRHGRQWYGLLPALGVSLCVPLYLLGYWVNDSRLSLVCCSTAGSLLFLHSVPTLVAFQNLVEANMRTTAAFIYFFVSTLIGVGLGPPLIGLLSDAYASSALGADYQAVCNHHYVTAACARSSSIGIRGALMTSLSLYGWAAVHYFCAAKAFASETAPAVKPPVGGELART